MTRYHPLTVRAQALTLACFTHLSYEEIGRITGISKSNVYNIVKSAKARGFDPVTNPRIIDEYVVDRPRSGRPRKHAPPPPQHQQHQQQQQQQQQNANKQATSDVVVEPIIEENNNAEHENSSEQPVEEHPVEQLPDGQPVEAASTLPISIESNFGI